MFIREICKNLLPQASCQYLELVEQRSESKIREENNQDRDTQKYSFDIQYLYARL